MNKTLFIGILVIIGFILVYFCSFKRKNYTNESYENFEERSTKELEKSLKQLDNGSTNSMEKFLLDQKKKRK